MYWSESSNIWVLLILLCVLQIPNFSVPLIILIYDLFQTRINSSDVQEVVQQVLQWLIRAQTCYS